MKSLLFTETNYNLVRRGIKTQTRRTGGLEFINMNLNHSKLLGWENDPDVSVNNIDGHRLLKGTYPIFDTYAYCDYDKMYINPRFQQGEIVYVKEPYILDKQKVYYLYDRKTGLDYKWKNKLFMPEKYARLFIKIKEIGCERVNEICNWNYYCEGIISSDGDCWGKFKKLWNSINNKWQYNKKFDVWLCYPYDEETPIPKIPKKADSEECIACINPYVFIYEFEKFNNNLKK